MTESWQSTAFCPTCRRTNPVELVKWSKPHEMRVSNKRIPTDAWRMNVMLDCEHMTTLVVSGANMQAIRAQAA